MAYDLHVLRSFRWTDSSDAPITKSDVDALVETDPELAWSTSDFMDSKDHTGAVTRFNVVLWSGTPCFWWQEDQLLCSAPDDVLVAKLVRVATALNARVIGDDGEVYELHRSLFGREKIVRQSPAVIVLRDGAAIVGAVLAPHRFRRSTIQPGPSSGGVYACCEFCRGKRLRMHFRHSLGLVEYEIDGVTLSHEEFMWSVQRRRGASSYPGFSKDPLDGFRRLAADIVQFGQDFISGSDTDFKRHAENAAILRRDAPRLPE
jgi:hypothetical protein